MAFEGRTRQAFYSGVGNTRQVGLSEMGGIQADQLLPNCTELARIGKVYGIVHTVATAVPPLQVVPTTTAAFVVNNTDVASGRNMVMLQCGAFLGSGTAGIGTTVMVGVTGAPLATQLTADGTGFTKLFGTGFNQGSVAFGDVSKGVIAGWVPIASVDNQAGAVPGTGISADLRGMFIVRPTYAFMMHAVAGAGTTAKFCFYAIWLELPITVSI